MTPEPAWIVAASGLGWRVEDTLPVLRARVRELYGTSIRRVNRLIQLALIGAGECARDQSLEPDCGLYLASGQGALQDAVDVFSQMFVDGSAPKPISFVNTLSNTACFYVAKCLGLRGPAQFVSASALPFESALSLALLDLARERVPQALVGGVDECVLPLADHRIRLRTGPDAPLGEGSHWLLLSRQRPSRPLGRLIDTRELPDPDAFDKWLATLAIDPGTWHVAFGSGISDTARTRLRTILPPLPELDYHPRDAYYETVTGAGICTFLRSRPTQRTTLLHVNASPQHRYSACITQALPR